MWDNDDEEECSCVGMCMCANNPYRRDYEEKESTRRIDYSTEYKSMHSFTYTAVRTRVTDFKNYARTAKLSKIDITNKEHLFRAALEETCSKCRWYMTCNRYTVCPKIENSYTQKLYATIRLKLGDKVILKDEDVCTIIKINNQYALLDVATIEVLEYRFEDIESIKSCIVILS